MDLRKYKPSRNFEDRRGQKGTTTIGQAARTYSEIVKSSLDPAQLASNARIVFGGKPDPDEFRKSVKLPNVKLRRKPALAGNDR